MDLMKLMKLSLKILQSHKHISIGDSSLCVSVISFCPLLILYITVVFSDHREEHFFLI